MPIIATINRVAVKIFGISIYWYAIIIVTGIMIAVWLAKREANRVGIREDDVIDYVFWMLPISIIGARLYYVIFEWSYYSQNLGQILNIRNGGLAIYGGLIAGGLTLFFFARHRFISVWTFLDVAAPGVILAQAIGRWGNFMNREAFGTEVSRQFLANLKIPDFIIENMFIDGAYHQPTFLYESVWNLLGFIVLILLRRKNNLLKQGEVFLSYVTWYATGRFFIEGMRTDSLMIGHVIRVSQLLSLILFIGAVFLMIYRRKKMALPYYKREEKTIL